MGIVESIVDFFNKLFEILDNITAAMLDTITYLDAIDFQQTFVFQFLGYVRYFLGDLNYIAITSVFIIGCGLALWSVSLKAVSYLKNLLPW